MDSSPEEVTTPPSPREDEDDDDEEDDEEEEEEEDRDTSSPSNAGTVIRAKPTLESLAHLRDLSKDAISWSLSSAKPGNGVEQIVHDVSTETYWQSDGGQPHYIRISFGRRVSVSHVALYLDYNLDESYTPKTVQVKAGMTIQDLRDVTGTMELQEPVGWCILPLTAPPDPLDAICCLGRDENNEETASFVRTHLVEISVLGMHQNGRDTHVRRVKLFGPPRARQYHAARMVRHDDNKTSVVLLDKTLEFTTVGMTQFNTIR
jgi:anaphase-promoting complex subunit 10